MSKFNLSASTLGWGAACIVPATACIALYPLFFVIFRLSVFSTVPTDDYAPYLLWVLGEPGGTFPLSPYCYRILSMAAAVPFYFLLPPLDLTNIPTSLPPSWVRATAALSALAYVSMVGTTLAMAAIAGRKCGLSVRDGMLAGLLLLLLTFYTQLTAIDPLAVLVVALAVLLLDRTWAFAALVLVSVGVNEKIALVLATWLSIRCVFSCKDRARLALPWACSLAAVGLYLAIVLLLRFPGHEYQLNPEGFLGTAIDNLSAYFSARGILLNALPAIVLAAIGAAGHIAGAPNRTPATFPATFRGIDLLTIPAMLAVGLVFTQQFQAGRLVMHAAPLFVLPFIASLPGRPQAPEAPGRLRGSRG